MSDDATGFNKIPDRYKTASGREKIDLIRDSMSESEFAIYCRGTALKYAGRNKPNPDPSKPSDDPEKHRFYTEMAEHLFSNGPDPRRNRPGFTPYKRASMPTPLPERRISLLDHGYVRFVEDWGQGDSRMSEAGIIEAARQSTQGCFRGWRRDQKLLQYLYENKHSTPFEFAGMTLEVRAPILIFRQWHRHRSQSYNEMSGRYTELPNLRYLPSTDRLVTGSREADAKNKQAGRSEGSPVLDVIGANAFRRKRNARYQAFEEEYEQALAAGVPKELARVGMPVGWYSQMRASGVLRNWLAFLTLRMDPHAQWEIRQYANAVHSLVEQSFPQTAALFNDMIEKSGRQIVG